MAMHLAESTGNSRGNRRLRTETAFGSTQETKASSTASTQRMLSLSLTEGAQAMKPEPPMNSGRIEVGGISSKKMVTQLETSSSNRSAVACVG